MTLLRCWSHGCEHAEIAKEVELTVADLFEHPLNGNYATSGQAHNNGHKQTEFAAIYSYRNEDGEELFQVCRRRHAEKGRKYLQRRKKDDGSWSWSTKDVRKVLYRLPELLNDDDPESVVVFCEGEKDADNVASRMTATSLPGGAKAKPPKWYNDAVRILRGRKVAIVPDNDKPGRLHAEAIATLLADHADVRVIELPGLETKGDVSDWIKTREDWDRELLRLFSDTDRFVVDDEDMSGRRQIELIPGLTHKATAEAMSALATDPDVYCRSGRLVRVGKLKSRPNDRIQRDENELRVIELSESVLKCRLSSVAGFFKWVKRGDELVTTTTDCPIDVTKAVRTDGIFDGVRQLRAVTTVPCMRPDGTVLDEPGYDPDTRLIFAPRGEIARVRQEPTQDDAKAAAERLSAVFQDFPFECNERGRAGCVALLLTLIGRPMIQGPVPLFLIDGNRAGSGKSLISDAAGVIAGHNRLPRTSAPTEEGEWRKVITSTAIAGLPVVLLDNIGGMLGSASLDAVLTGTDWRDRRLGGNEIERFEVETVWIATGNNVGIRGDLYRRLLRIPLDCKVEDPEARTDFKHPNLIAWIQTNKTQLLADALTILRAWHIAGRPANGLEPWGSYEAFTPVVRGSLVFAGLADPAPASDRKEIQDRSDSRRAALPVLMNLWPLGEHSEPDELTSGELFRIASDGDHEPLMDVLDELVKSRSGVNAKSLGWTLREFKGQVVGGQRIVERTGHSKQKLWTVRPV